MTRLKRRMTKEAWRYVSGCAYVDRGLGESICVVEPKDVASFLYGRFGTVDWRVADLFESGLVLSDPRGGGALQLIGDEEDEH